MCVESGIYVRHLPVLLDISTRVLYYRTLRNELACTHALFPSDVRTGQCVLQATCTHGHRDAKKCRGDNVAKNENPNVYS